MITSDLSDEFFDLVRSVSAHLLCEPIEPQTKAAAMPFQNDQGLAADGVVGPNTRAALQAALTAAGLI